MRATSWQGGTKDRRQTGMLNICIPSAVGSFEGGAYFARESREAVVWGKGVAAWGTYLTTRSGFSSHVTTRPNLRGTRGQGPPPVREE